MRSFATIVALAAFCMLAPAKSKAEPWFSPIVADDAAFAAQRVVVFGDEKRQTLDSYAKRNRIDARDLRRRHSGSGLIRCGNARGAGQLTLVDDVITTAAHVFFDIAGASRAAMGPCEFIIELDGEQIITRIDPKSIVTGSWRPYQAAPANDWAVARLERPLPQARPYGLGAAVSGDPVRFVARGHVDWGDGRKTSIEDCRLRESLDDGIEGTREFAFDCAAGIGASGGALLNAAGADLLAIFVGYHSYAPDARAAFSADNYNFAVSVEGAFRLAVLDAAGLRTAAAR